MHNNFIFVSVFLVILLIVVLYMFKLMHEKQITFFVSLNSSARYKNNNIQLNKTVQGEIRK